MTTLRRALGNSSNMLTSQLITWTATLVLTGALGRSLGDTGFGKLYVAMSLCMVFSVLVDFGLDQQLIRDVARDRTVAGVYLVNSVTIKTALATVAYGLVLLLAYLLEYPPDLRLTITVYCLLLFLNGVSASLTAVYQATENVLHASIGTVLEKCAVAALAVLMLALGGGLIGTAAVFVVGAAVGMAWKAFFLLRRVRPVALPERRLARTLFIGALPFFLYWALGSVYYRLFVVLLSNLTDATVSGC